MISRIYGSSVLFVYVCISSSIIITRDKSDIIKYDTIKNCLLINAVDEDKKSCICGVPGFETFVSLNGEKPKCISGVKMGWQIQFKDDVNRVLVESNTAYEVSITNFNKPCKQSFYKVFIWNIETTGNGYWVNITQYAKVYFEFTLRSKTLNIKALDKKWFGQVLYIATGCPEHSFEDKLLIKVNGTVKYPINLTQFFSSTVVSTSSVKTRPLSIPIHMSTINIYSQRPKTPSVNFNYTSDGVYHNTSMLTWYKTEPFQTLLISQYSSYQIQSTHVKSIEKTQTIQRIETVSQTAGVVTNDFTQIKTTSSKNKLTVTAIIKPTTQKNLTYGSTDFISTTVSYKFPHSVASSTIVSLTTQQTPVKKTGKMLMIFLPISFIAAIVFILTSLIFYFKVSKRRKVDVENIDLSKCIQESTEEK